MSTRGRQDRDVLRLIFFGGLSFLRAPQTVLAKCPNWCSQSGICTGPGDDAFCICEMGYQGDDCAVRMCPKGDDPLTTGQTDRALILRTSADEGLLRGELTFTFNGETVALDADAHRSGDRECASALNSLPNIDRVSCARGPVSENGGADYLISITRFPTIPWENNFYAHMGNPALDAFSCNMSSEHDEGISALVSPACELVDVVTENVKEYSECSQHGTCVRETGRCECNFGFRGDACDDITDSDDAQVVLAEGPYFTGSAFKLRANRGLSPDFSFIKAIAGPLDVRKASKVLDQSVISLLVPTAVMTLTGTGDLILHQGSLRIQPPAPGSSSALQNAAWMNKTPPEAVVISGGSLGVVGGGAHISSTRTKSSALAISVGPETGERDQSPTIEEDGIFRYVGVALSVNVKETSSHDTGEMNATTPAEAHDSFSLMELSVGGADESRSGGDLQGWQEAREKKVLMSVRGDGRVMMAGGGGVLLSAGDLEVSKGDVLIKGDVDVRKALAVGVGGVSVGDGGGIKVTNGTFEARMDSAADAVSFEDEEGSKTRAVGQVSAGHRHFAGDVLRVDASGSGAADAGAVLLRASSGGEDVFEIKASGATSIKAGGLDVDSGGLRVGSGGVAVTSGGLTVDGGIHLRTGTFTIDDGVDGTSEGRGFEVLAGGIRASSSDASTTALAAAAAGQGFGGTVLSVAALNTSPSSSFRLLQATVGGGAIDGNVRDTNGDPLEVFAVDGTGRITASGGLETGEDGKLIAGGGILSRGSTVMQRKRASRDSDEDDGTSIVEIDAGDGTFFEVPDDAHDGSANVLQIKGVTAPGQLLLIYNGDGDPTSGDFIIPPGYTVLLIHDGMTWRDLRVLEAAVTTLDGVKSLSAAADLDIGQFALKARHLVSSGATAGGVVFFGGGGLLTSDKSYMWDAASGTLTVPRLHASEMAEGMDFKGKPIRNVAIVNATIDSIPFLKTGRLMLEAAILSAQDTYSVSDGHMTPAMSGSGLGLAAFDKRGELSRTDGFRAMPGGFLGLKGLGPHSQEGDVDFQGYTARNITLSDVASLTGLERMEVRQLFLTKPSESKDVESLESREGPIQEGKLAILTNNMELRSAGEAFSVNSQTGTLTVPRLGPHAVLGDVDYLGNTIRNAVLRGPDIRGTVPSLHAAKLALSPEPSISRGFLAVFSEEDFDASVAASAKGGAIRRSLGLAAGGGGLAWRNGAIQDLRLGGTTTLEGDLDLAGHRLLNVDAQTPDLENLEELTVRRTFKLERHASSIGSLLNVGVGGEIVPTDPASLSLNAASATISGPIISDEISCLGSATVEGQLAVTGGVTVGGSLTFDKDGVNARGSRIANAQLENVTFQGSVQGVVGFAGGVTIGTLQRNGDRGGALRVLATGSDGELMTMPGVEFMEEDEVLVVKSLSGHKVTGTVDFAGQELISPNINLTVGGGVHGMSSLSVGEGGLNVGGMIQAASEVMIEGSLTVAGAVLGRGPYMDTSDRRLKKDVEGISAVHAAFVVRRLRAVTYELKPNQSAYSAQDGNSGASDGSMRKRQVGLIAQEVEEVVPEVIAEDRQGFKAIAYSRLVPIVVSALSSALDRLDSLEQFSPAMRFTGAPPPCVTFEDDRKLDTLTSELHTAGSVARGHHAHDIDGDRNARAMRMASRMSKSTKDAGNDLESDDTSQTINAYTGEDRKKVIEMIGLEAEAEEVGANADSENTALRRKVSELEERLLELEHKLTSLVGT